MCKKIKVGDTFICIKTVKMNLDKSIVYRKGIVYNSEIDRCITNDNKDKSHRWGRYSESTKEHFLKIKYD